MANAEHLKVLKQGVKKWNEWREENTGIRPDLRPDLGETYLIGADLRGADFWMADLCRANLTEAKISDADLILAMLHGATLTQAELFRSNLSRADLGDAVLTRADLNNATLEDAILTSADLDYANLSDAGLVGANLFGANLYKATLENANLQAADFRSAVLEGANLRGAYLGGVNFSSAELDGADLSGASLSNTIFGYNDLSNIVGLELVEFKGPSVIGTETLKLSRGSIPKSFLRGCGLSEWEIEAASLYKPDIDPARVVEILYKVSELRSDPLLQFYSCFISYSHGDEEFARWLFDALQRRGVRCWLDKHQLLPGDDIFERVDQGIRVWDKVLLCCSKDSLTSWWVDNEINTAFEKEQQLTRQRGEKILALIPLDRDGFMFSGEWKSGKAAQIKSRLVADFTTWETDHRKFGEEFERLVRALRADAGGRETPPTPKL